MSLSSSTLTLDQIPSEILKVICGHLRHDNRSLASLAITSYIFEEPATDVLWSYLGDFYPLAICLPSNVRGEKEFLDNKRLVLTQPLLLSNCSRLLHYAKKVRRLYFIYKNETRRIDEELLNGIQVALQGRMLFPNVQELHWEAQNFEKSPLLNMFMGLHLTEIYFTFSAGSYAQMTWIPIMYEKYPWLKSVEFSFYPETPMHRARAVEFLSQSINKWENLNSLAVPNLTYSTLLTLSESYHLKSLKITECDLSDIPNATHKGGFPALRNLHVLHCRSASSCISVLTLMDCPALERVHITFANIETSSSWANIFRTLNQHCSHDTLFDIFCWDGTARNREIIYTAAFEDMVTYETIKPLLDFHNLRELDASFATGVYMSDPSSIKEMATAWKKIRCLKLEVLYGSRNAQSSKITPLDLLLLVKRCHHLHTIDIPFNAFDIPWEVIGSYRPNRTRGWGICELYVGESPIRVPGAVAALLSAIFPNLKNVGTIEEEEAEEEELRGPRHRFWKEAEELMCMFKIVRNQERLYPIE